MQRTTFRSGDPAADRRAMYAETMFLAADTDAAIEVLRGALDLVPDWAAGWFRLGEYHEAAGNTDAALAAWDRALAADPSDPFGASLKRDLARPEPLMESLPPAFVESLFDQYAPRFDRALRDGLDYRGPEILVAALRAAGFQRASRAIDLGCGTGLVGGVLRPHCDWLAGVDLSAGMLAEARAKAIYDWTDKADLNAMPLPDTRYDLIAAADVFNYLGALESVIAWCAASLSPGGLLAFTVERGDTVALQDSRRFTHSHAYLADLLTRAGFHDLRLEPCTCRLDRGQPVASLCVTARSPGSVVSREGEGDLGVPA